MTAHELREAARFARAFPPWQAECWAVIDTGVGEIEWIRQHRAILGIC